MAKESAQSVSLFIEKIKRHPIVLVVAFTATLIVSLATLTDAIDQLSNLVGGMSREEAREELRKLGLQYTADVFVESARNSDVRVVGLFLTAGMDVDSDDQGITALMHAAANNDAQMTQLLLDAGANVNYSETVGIAASSADPNILRLLLDHQASNDTIDRAFVFAAPTAGPDNLALLWEKVSARHKVASRGLLNIAEGMEDNCAAGGVERVRYQLQLGADPNITDDDGYFPLLYLSRGKCIDAARLLLEGGADINARCACPGWLAGGWTALLVASDHEESLQMVELLLERNADMQARTNDGSNALALAVEKNNSAVVDLLISKRIDINAADSAGVTALMNASGDGRLDIMRLLIAAGADVNAQSKRGYTALMRASRESNAETVGYLLKENASAELKTSEGLTALMLAAQQGNVDTVQMLIAHGAQPAARDQTGRTAAELAAVSLADEGRRDSREKILYLLRQKDPGGKSRVRP